MSLGIILVYRAMAGDEWVKLLDIPFVHVDIIQLGSALAIRVTLLKGC